MKKGILFIIFIVFTGFGEPAHEVSPESTFQTIPDEAIRLRILANSDSDQDQYIKRLVRDDVNAFITDLVEKIDNIEEARETIAANVPTIERIVEESLSELNVSQSFTVDYSSNVTFPMKVYDNFVYPAGEYEAVLISIGEGKGSNWWCVLFPPLCFLDFSNGTTVAQTDDQLVAKEDTDQIVDNDESESDFQEEDVTDESDEEEVEVKFFLFEWLGLS